MCKDGSGVPSLCARCAKSGFGEGEKGGGHLVCRVMAALSANVGDYAALGVEGHERVVRNQALMKALKGNETRFHYGDGGIGNLLVIMMDRELPTNHRDRMIASKFGICEFVKVLEQRTTHVGIASGVDGSQSGQETAKKLGRWFKDAAGGKRAELVQRWQSTLSRGNFPEIDAVGKI
jgi:hypothetical protein